MERTKTSLLKSYYDFYYAKEIGRRMYPVFKRKCSGCQHSRLSQLDHTCLTLSDKQQLELYFEDVILEVDENQILSKWIEAASIIDVPSGLIETMKIKLFDMDSHRTYKKTLQWKTRMIRMVVQVVLLEKRFS